MNTITKPLKESQNCFMFKHPIEAFGEQIAIITDPFQGINEPYSTHTPNSNVPPTFAFFRPEKLLQGTTDLLFTRHFEIHKFSRSPIQPMQPGLDRSELSQNNTRSPTQRRYL